MVTLTMMSMGGSLPFMRGKALDRARLPGLITITLISSVLGALVVFMVPAEILPLLIPMAMVLVLVLVFLLGNHRRGIQDEAPPSRARIRAGYFSIFALGIYGGFFSGGYVTMLIASCVGFFRYSFLRAMAMSRVMNIASSLIATCVFAWHGAIEWKLAMFLGCTAFAGALVGARWARQIPEKVLRSVFITAVAILAIKSLVFDVPWSRLV